MSEVPRETGAALEGEEERNAPPADLAEYDEEAGAGEEGGLELVPPPVDDPLPPPPPAPNLAMSREAELLCCSVALRPAASRRFCSSCAIISLM
jgi:hypothetical protein